LHLLDGLPGSDHDLELGDQAVVVTGDDVDAVDRDTVHGRLELEDGVVPVEDALRVAKARGAVGRVRGVGPVAGEDLVGGPEVEGRQVAALHGTEQHWRPEDAVLVEEVLERRLAAQRLVPALDGRPDHRDWAARCLDGAGHVGAAAHRGLDLSVVVRAAGDLHRRAVVLRERVIHQWGVAGATGGVDRHPAGGAFVGGHQGSLRRRGWAWILPYTDLSSEDPGTPGRMARISNMIGLAKVSWGVFLKGRDLLVLPIVHCLVLHCLLFVLRTPQFLRYRIPLLVCLLIFLWIHFVLLLVLLLMVLIL